MYLKKIVMKLHTFWLCCYIGNENAEFKDFIEAETCIDTMKTFQKVTAKLGVDDAPHEKVFDRLRLELPNREDREILNCVKECLTKNAKLKGEPTDVSVYCFILC